MSSTCSSSRILDPVRPKRSASFFSFFLFFCGVSFILLFHFSSLFLSVQFSGNKNIHHFGQLSPLFISRPFSSSQTETLHPLNPNLLPLTLQDLVATLLFSVSMNLTSPGIHSSGIMQYLSFWVWLLSFRIMFSRFFHVVSGVRISFLLGERNLLFVFFF